MPDERLAEIEATVEKSWGQSVGGAASQLRLDAAELIAEVRLLRLKLLDRDNELKYLKEARRA